MYSSNLIIIIKQAFAMVAMSCQHSNKRYNKRYNTISLIVLCS